MIGRAGAASGSLPPGLAFPICLILLSNRLRAHLAGTVGVRLPIGDEVASWAMTPVINGRA